MGSDCLFSLKSSRIYTSETACWNVRNPSREGQERQDLSVSECWHSVYNQATIKWTHKGVAIGHPLCAYRFRSIIFWFSWSHTLAFIFDRLDSILCCFPFGKFPLTFLAFVKGKNIRQQDSGDILNLMLRDTAVVDELFVSAQVAPPKKYSAAAYLPCSGGSVSWASFSLLLFISGHSSVPISKWKCSRLSSLSVGSASASVSCVIMNIV